MVALRVRGEMGVRMLIRQGSFIQRVVDTWTSLIANVVEAKIVNRVKLELDRNLEALERERGVCRHWQD